MWFFFLKDGLRDENVCPSEAQTRQLKEVELVWMSLNGPDDGESETSIVHFFLDVASSYIMFVWVLDNCDGKIV